MTPISLTQTIRSPQMTIWLAGVSFVLFQFFLQLSSGVVIDAIMREMQLTALAAGILSSAFYYVYTSLQIPVGMLYDLKSARVLIVNSLILCSIGCLLFAHSYTFIFLMVGRLLIGGGAAFAFIGLSHLLRQHFPLNQFAFMIGLSETLAFLVTVAGMVGLGVLLNQWGWRSFMDGTGLIGFFLAYRCWQIIPESPNTLRHSEPNDGSPQLSLFRPKDLIAIFRSWKLWANGLFVGLSFSVITVFGAMWAIPFIQIKLGCDLKQASIIDAFLFLGTAVSCPLFGYLSNRIRYRRLLMLFSCLVTAFFLIIVLFYPIQNKVIFALLMCMIGLSCGAYMLSYTIANELAPKEALSTCTGFINTLAMLTAPLLQPLVGFLLDVSSAQHAFQIIDYQWALSIIPAGLIIASALVFFLPEKPAN